MSNTSVALDNLVKAIYAYRSIDYLSDNHIIDMDKTVRWNREEVVRLNKTVDERRNAAYTNCSERITELVDAILGEDENKSITDETKAIIADSLHEELTNVLNDVTAEVEGYGNNYADPVDDSINRIVQRSKKTLSILRRIECEKKKRNTLDAEHVSWMDIKRPFTFSYEGIQYSCIYNAIMFFKYGLTEKAEADSYRMLSARKLSAYIRKEKLKPDDKAFKDTAKRNATIENIFISAMRAGLYKELLATGDKELVAKDSIGEYGSILMKIRAAGREEMLNDFLSKENSTNTGFYDIDGNELCVGDEVILVNHRGYVSFENGAYGITVKEGIDWESVEKWAHTETKRTPCFLHNENFISLFEISCNSSENMNPTLYAVKKIKERA